MIILEHETDELDNMLYVTPSRTCKKTTHFEHDITLLISDKLQNQPFIFSDQAV